MKPTYTTEEILTQIASANWRELEAIQIVMQQEHQLYEAEDLHRLANTYRSRVLEIAADDAKMVTSLTAGEISHQSELLDAKELTTLAQTALGKYFAPSESIRATHKLWEDFSTSIWAHLCTKFQFYVMFDRAFPGGAHGKDSSGSAGYKLEFKGYNQDGHGIHWEK